MNTDATIFLTFPATNPLWQQVYNCLWFFAAIEQQHDCISMVALDFVIAAFPFPCHDDRHSFWGLEAA